MIDTVILDLEGVIVDTEPTSRNRTRPSPETP